MAPSPDTLLEAVLTGAGSCPSCLLAAMGAMACSPGRALEEVDGCTVAHATRAKPILPRSTRGTILAGPFSVLTTMCASLPIGSVPHPQASTARIGFVLAVESSLSPLRLTLRRGLVGPDQLRVRGTAAPAAWCRVVPKHRLAVNALLLCRCYVTPKTPAGVGWLLANRWPSDAVIAVVAEADMPRGRSATDIAPPAWRCVMVTEADPFRPLTRPPAMLSPTPGGAPRLRAFAGAPTESALAAESSVNRLTLGLLTLDRASGRGATTPATGCRAIRVALAVGAPLLLRSMHGPLKPSPEGG